MHAEYADSVAAVSAAEWNQLQRDGNPFLSHEFLLALERQGCLGESFGWFPHHLLIRAADGRLLAAAPAYVKTNSYGEFVFDWSWAEAYQRSGLPYYPKLVVGVPYNPVSGPRMLLHPQAEPGALRAALHEAAQALGERLHLSGVHWLFTTEAETRFLAGRGLATRLGCQYHWHNPGYRDFDDYLDGMLARKRKQIRRERRRHLEQGVSIGIRHGDELSEAEIRLLHHYYAVTFDRKWGMPTLSAGFFMEIAATLGRQLVVVFAEHAGRSIAAAIMLRSERVLFGRFWGCDQEYHSLHFEACYYQGIDYCIEQRLQRFEPGAQGEHKISRGFLPVETWSAHWLADARFRAVVGRYLEDERQAVQEQCSDLRELSPFRQDRAARDASRWQRS